MKRACFGALVIPDTPDCHITIVVNKDASNVEINQIQQDLERIIRPHLPIRVRIGNYQLLGSDNSIPAYGCQFVDPTIAGLIAKFYADRYKGQQGKRLFPVLEPHVTVDAPERLAAIEDLIFEQRGLVQVTETIFRTHSEGEAAPPLAPKTSETVWKCSECHKVNPIGRRECSGHDCDQWRPREMMPSKPGDWRCCGMVQFASRSSCFKCGKPKNGVPNAYHQPPFAPSAPLLHRRRGSWDCQCCGDHQFAKNLACRMCGVKKP